MSLGGRESESRGVVWSREASPCLHSVSARATVATCICNVFHGGRFISGRKNTYHSFLATGDSNTAPEGSSPAFGWKAVPSPGSKISGTCPTHGKSV